MIIKKFSELTTLELYHILALRSEVFVVEQECIYQDIDYKDLNAYHLFIKENNSIVAYTRLLNRGVSYDDGVSIGRVVVSPKARKRGYGIKLMKQTIEFANKTYPDIDIIISAQEYLYNFYTSLGFQKISDMYLEDNIPHIKMIKKQQTN